MGHEFVGRGWAFPIRTDGAGRIAMVSREEEVAESMRLVLGTAFGERPMRPEFGCAVHDLVFDPTDRSLAGLISYEVRASLVRWEPRIAVDRVDVTFDATRPSTAYIDVHYRLRDANDPRNLVFPFYFIPEEGEG